MRERTTTFVLKVQYLHAVILHMELSSGQLGMVKHS